MTTAGKTPGAVAREFEKGKIFYAHFRTAGKGSVTIAIEEVRDQDTVVEHLVGWAFCAPRDQFTKKLGRTISRGRRIPMAQKFQGDNLFDLAKQTVEFLYEVRQDYDTTDPVGKEPPVPRWLPEFYRALECEQALRDLRARCVVCQ